MEGPHSLLPITGNLQYQQPQGGAVVNHRNQQQERKPRPQAEQALKCPRCASTNTKFCYYNNYSLSQPRYFCKGCRRYWTQGGSLRNVPVGGGCRKNKRSSSSSSSSFCSSSSKISKSSLSSDLNATNANKAADSFTAPLPSSIPPVCNNLAMAFADNIFLLGHATANTATATNPTFLDVLTSAAASSSTGIVPNTGGLMSSLYFGAEQEGPLMSFEGGGGGGGVQERALEERVREPNSSWQGLVMNGSLMEGTRMDMPFSALGDAYSFF